MRTVSAPIFLCLILVLGLINVSAAPVSDFASSGKTVILTDGNGPSKFLCVPETGVDGKTVRLICVAGGPADANQAVSQQPARDNAEIFAYAL